MIRNVTYILSALLLLSYSCTDNLSEELESNWEYESPINLGVSGSHLVLLDREIKRGALGDVNSLLILKDDKVIFENYYNGFGPDSLNHLGRASQSIFTLFLGRIIEEQSIPMDTLIVNYFPEYSYQFDNIPQKDKIRFQHLIDHESGFWWEDWDRASDPAKSDAFKMQSADDWVDHVLSTRMIREPGMDFNYNSGHSILLSEIVRKELDQDLSEYFDEQFFKPLNIKSWQWKNTPGGRLNTASGLSLNTNDMAKIGQLILKNGESKDGEILISKEWMGYLRKLLAQNNSYWIGPSWYRFAPQNNALPRQFSNDVLFCWGDGGKFIMAVPHQNMVIVMNAERVTVTQEQELFKYIGDYIFASTTPTPQP